MITRDLTWLLFVALIATLSCSKSELELGPAEFPEDYAEQIDAFYANRHASLTKPAGWMRIDGMYWLDQGMSSFGSDSSVSVVFPENKIPGNAGVFVVSGDSVWIRAEKDIYFEHSDSLVTELLMYPTEQEVSVRYGDLEWIIIKRGDLIGIRLFNADNPLVDTFEGFPRFDINQNYHVLAELVTQQVMDSVKIANILGQEEMIKSPGVLRFQIAGEEYQLTALLGGERMFLIVGDLTNQTESYQAGRYLYVDYPAPGKHLTFIDFNKMYNPPCAYSAFTTCQLPPIQNRLHVEIPAGEKRPQPEYRPQIVYY
jgi:uncharacterized protein